MMKLIDYIKKKFDLNENLIQNNNNIIAISPKDSNCSALDNITGNMDGAKKMFKAMENCACGNKVSAVPELTSKSSLVEEPVINMISELIPGVPEFVLRLYLIRDIIEEHDLHKYSNSFFENTFNYWHLHIGFISLIMFTTIISIIAFFVPRTPKSISALNVLSAFIIFIYILTLPLHNFQANIQPLIGIEYTPFVYLFILCAGLHTISFLAINNEITFIKNNSKIEYPLLIIFLFFSSFILIAATNWLIILLTLEVITFIIAVLVAFQPTHYLTPSVGIRYILFSAIPSGALILGIIEFYTYSGSFNLFDIEKILIIDSLLIDNITITQQIEYLNLIYNTLYPLSFDLTETYMKDCFYLILDAKPIKILNQIDYINIAEIILEKAPESYHRSIEKFSSFNEVGYHFASLLGTTDLTPFIQSEKLCYELVFKLNHNINTYYYYNTFIDESLIKLKPLLSLNHENNKIPLIIIIALYLIMFNILFKLTAAPFHFWAPVIYEGAPLAITMFLSIFTKIVMIFFLIKILITSMLPLYSEWSNLLYFSGLLSILVGIYGAMSETKIKRFFVFSSIGHVGFMLLGIANSSGNLEGQVESLTATIIYLIIYIISTFICWLILFCSNKNIIYLTQLNGLAKNNSILSLILAIIVLSMSGIPPLAGFFVKFEILHTLLQSQAYGLTFLTLLFTIFSFFYYLRIIKILYFEPTNKHTVSIQFNKTQATILASFFYLIIGFTIYFQQPIIYNINSLIYQLLC